MPTVKLRDQFGFSGDFEAPEGTSFAKYFRNLRELKISDLKLAALEITTLDKVPVKSASGGITFEQPIGIGIDHAEMTISVGASGTLTLFAPRDKQLFNSDRFAEPIAINADQYYVSIGFAASLAGNLSGEKSDLSFGFDAGSHVLMNCYRPFGKTDAGAYPSLIRALEETIKGFVILGDVEDLAGMSDGTVATIEGNGSLKFSGGVELLGIVNPLASVGLPGPIGDLQIASGNSIKVNATFEIAGGYQIRAHKFAKNKVRLGYYRNRETEFTLKVAAKSGISAGLGEFDLLGRTLQAISKNPKVDKELLQAGGLAPAPIAQIEKTLEAAIARKLELAMSAELSAAGATEAAFLYEIEFDKLSAEGRRALHLALDGDLSELVGREASMPAGIKLVRSIFTETRKKKHTLKLNLLGIYNFISVGSLILKGSVMYEPEGGEVVITDSATASRIAASTFNFAADAGKLRKVMAESFLITAAYRCSKLVAASPSLKISHSYFELHSKTNRATMRNNLDVIEALALLTKQEKEKLLGASNDFGRTTFYAETSYSDDLVSNLFLVGDKPRAEEEYEQAGRDAIKLLVQTGEADEYRRFPATDNVLWKEMRTLGNPATFKSIEKIKAVRAATMLPMEIIVGGIGTDFIVIRWWAREMRQMGERLAEIRQFLRKNPGIDPENNSFKSLRRSLAEQLKDVARRTRSEFGDPWGLVAMDLLTNKKASAKIQLTGPRVALARER
jgi:hypothetical protein